MQVRVQTEDFDVAAELAALRKAGPEIGALVSFIGLVRDINDGARVAGMELEHYPGMTEKALHEIAMQAAARWNLIDSLIIHRVGALLPLDQIVFVAVASRHRGDAFAACEYIMDYLKTQAPFWKKEQTPEGARWVDARETDEHALKKWEAPLSASMARAG
jgi:molybdopterin synthase catalytic subunit